MDVPPLNFRSLRYLQEVERSGSFTEAAWGLGISQPALSHSLAELARRLGVPLFRRDGRRRVLTEAGQRVAHYADKVIGQTTDLLRWLESWERGEVGSLRVGMIDTVGLYTLPAGLSRLQEELPDIDLQLVVAESAELLSMLDDYQADLAFVVGPAGARYNSMRITVERMHVYSLAHDPPAAPGHTGGYEPSSEGWALYPPGSRTRLLIDQGLAQLGVRPEVALESAHPTVLRQMAVLGYASTVLPRQVAEAGPGSPLDEGPLVALRVIEAVWRVDSDLDPRAARLLELVGSDSPDATVDQDAGPLAFSPSTP
ncbi:MAG: LysR family transcriptional regulator [bacterium]|nr:LysR family transcriptional regulator [bacterium]MDE0289063.1 LysR family transcriptional regulator [bacterium]MDE0439369.1 LysR family transcriptional regulator [bacterium]